MFICGQNFPLRGFCSEHHFTKVKPEKVKDVQLRTPFPIYPPKDSKRYFPIYDEFQT